MAMLNRERLLSASNLFGEAAINPAVWPNVMDVVAAEARATGALLLQSDVRTSDVPRTESVRDLAARYFGQGWHINDARAHRGVPLMLAGARVIIDQDLFTPEELERDVFYNECLVPIGFQWFAAIGFRAGDALWAMSIQRTREQGPFDASDKLILASLSDKLTEAASLSSLIGRTALSAATSALEQIGRAAFSIDVFGRVMNENSKAAELWNDEMYVKNGRLTLADARARGLFENWLDALRSKPAMLAAACSPILVRSSRNPPRLLRAVSIPAAATTPFSGARAILTVTPISAGAGPAASVLAGAFGLTPAEAKLATLIAEGLDPKASAERLRISTQTARSQLKSIFAKTETHRQGELVALLSGLR